MELTCADIGLIPTRYSQRAYFIGYDYRLPDASVTVCF